MEILVKFLNVWLVNIRNLILLIVPLILWAVIFTATSALYDNCNNGNGRLSFLTKSCIDEGVRNTEIINVLFLILFVIAFTVTVIFAIFEYFANEQT